MMLLIKLDQTHFQMVCYGKNSFFEKNKNKYVVCL